MKLLLAWFCLVLLAISHPRNDVDENALKAIREKIVQTNIGCTPNWNLINIASLANEMVPLPGAGKWSWKISTSNDSAQFYFNQGINLYYGFHIIEAVPSFRKAQQFDPGCAMLYWGEALALGPNINDIGYSASVDASKAADLAVQHLSSATQKEQSLIKAMQLRYSKDSATNQIKLNEQYAAAMRLVFKENEQDADIGSLFADALMLLHPWDFWYHNGSPKEWTPEIVQVLETVLKKSPLHPGANHYYIHTVEASDDPAKAMQSADRLGSLAPSLSHMVHMPSHIYVRTGKFEKGIQVNTDAIKGYDLYKTLFPAVSDKVDLYEIHNRHMQAACAINVEDYPNALKLAESCRNSIPADWLTIPGMGYYVQYIYLSPEFIMAAFGHWDEILDQPEIPDNLVYGKILQAFCKGLAYVQKGNIQQSQTHLQKMQALLADSSLSLPIGAMNAPLSGGLVAQAILEGAIAGASGDQQKSIAAYSKAVELEDAMIYNEPKDWLLPARYWLGNAYLKSGDYNKALKIFEADLQKNPGSLFAKKGQIAAKKRKS
ncbi:tetratricopeptide repeat protein [Flavihumibacter fluvii]|uniref:tetratricopeptide repeat protein n=1 Tax=Flavihumibacter fluvii TaxID=2838157 RepID=UPI001BDE0B03|nr:tetratricopeptide repeat protein [Flavihumibacter fluvii]ULQ53465.1 tetratricopeptide repeat protein [Flavihumibacter fluvii]